MLTLRKASDRFHSTIDWLDSWHSFSFGEHYDAAHMGFGPLRVINEDRVRGGAGFPTHGHRDMEIITVVLSGTLQHKDNTGGGSVIKPGDVQKMSAGSGILHSEFNASQTEEVHLLQIWIMPNVKNVKPGYVQVHFAAEQMRDRWCLVVAGGFPPPIGGSSGGGHLGDDASHYRPHPNPPPAGEGVIPIYQDAKLFIADVSAGKTLEYAPEINRKLWIQVALGEVAVNGTALHAGDGLAIEKENALSIAATSESKILLFDMG